MTTSPNHTTKVNRALRLSSIGRYGASASAMLQTIPDEVIAALSARHIASILDANWGLAQMSKAIASREIIENGFVWDTRKNRAVDLANV